MYKVLSSYFIKQKIFLIFFLFSLKSSPRVKKCAKFTKWISSEAFFVFFVEIYLLPGLFSRVLCLSNVQKTSVCLHKFPSRYFIDLGVAFDRQIYHVTYSTSNIRLLWLMKKLFSASLSFSPFFQVSSFFLISSAFCLLTHSSNQYFIASKLWRTIQFYFSFSVFSSPFSFLFSQWTAKRRRQKIHFLFIKSTEKSLLSLNAEILLIPPSTLSHSLSRVSRFAQSYITINENFSLKDFRLP